MSEEKEREKKSVLCHKVPWDGRSRVSRYVDILA